VNKRFDLLNLDTIRIEYHVILKGPNIQNNLRLSMIHNLEELKRFHYKKLRKEQLHLVEENKHMCDFDKVHYHYSKLRHYSNHLQEELVLVLEWIQGLELGYEE